MSDATDAIVDIVEAITEYGSSCTLRIVAKGLYNTTTGETSNVNTDVPTKCLIMNYDNKELESPDIHVDDLKFFIYYDGDVSIKDKIIFSGKTYNFMKVDKKILQDVNLLYTIQGRV